MHPDATTLVARARDAYSNGRLDEAERLYRAALAYEPRRPDVLYDLAQVLENAQQPQAAIACLEEALAYAPGHAQTLHYLGILLADAQRFDEAISRFREAIGNKPDYARAYNNLGNALRSARRHEEAIAAFGAAARLQPGYLLAYFNLGALLRELGRYAEAEAALRHALRLQPKHRESLIALAGVLRQTHRLDEAIGYYRTAIALKPEASAIQAVMLSDVLIECGRCDEARALVEQMLAREPGSLRLRLSLELMLKPVYASRDDLAQARALYAEGLRRLRGESEKFASASEKEVVEALARNNFYLAYQGEDDQLLQTEYAALVGGLLDRAWPEFRHPLALRPRERRRPRIGFASSFFYDSTAGVYFRSWVTGLDRNRCEIYVYHLRSEMSALAHELSRHAHCFRHLGTTRDARVVARAIHGDALDVLVYPELGMDGLSFLLAALRLAPVQCAGWGHPVTTGHPTIDHYFSSAIMEPEDADSHYSERLVRLPGIGTAYANPATTATRTRAELGLPEAKNLYLCPQSLYKIHPDNDALFARVLAADPDGVLVLFQGRHPNVTEQFMRRLAPVLSANGIDMPTRTHVLPYVSRQDYLCINQICNAMLDTLHWSGGNTSLDALASGLPPVTLPGRFMRGRQTYGMLRLLDIPELIASDLAEYVNIAVRLAQDSAWRQDKVERIRAGRAKLFDDPAPVAALQAFYERVTESIPADSL